MRLIQKNVNRSSLPWILPVIVLLLISLLSSTAGAADYYVWGRVYSASALAEGEEEPNNPLDDVQDGQIIGDDMFAVTPRNLVKVRVIDASNGSELGSSETVIKDGGYLVSFSTLTGGNIEVRFVVEELSTSKILLDSDPNELSPWPAPNIRFLLVFENVAEIGGDREFAPAPASPATLTGIFTRVGKIEVETEVGGTNHRLIGKSTGLVNVPQVVSNDLHIPEYQDAPFGGNLYIFGAFSKDLYNPPSPSGEYYYRIKYVNADDAFDTGYIDDPLVKTKYTVNFGTGTVDTERVTLGPLPETEADGYSFCYKLTPIAASNNVFWSFPDLVALWRTGQINGKYKITLEAVDLSGPEVPPTPPPAPPGWGKIDYFTDVNLCLDNVPPVAKILPLDPSDFDTPRVYTPGPSPGEDLDVSLLGAFPANYGGMEDPTCMILNIESPPDKYLAFKLTGYHANGYLRYWHFWYERNDNDSKILIGKKYDGITDSMVNYPGALITSGQTNVDGFQDMYLYVSNGILAPSCLSCPASCAYRFVIRAATRTTDGYNYLRWAWDDDIHYLLR